MIVLNQKKRLIIAEKIFNILIEFIKDEAMDNRLIPLETKCHINEKIKFDIIREAVVRELPIRPCTYKQIGSIVLNVSRSFYAINSLFKNVIPHISNDLLDNIVAHVSRLVIFCDSESIFILSPTVISYKIESVYYLKLSVKNKRYYTVSKSALTDKSITYDKLIDPNDLSINI